MTSTFSAKDPRQGPDRALQDALALHRQGKHDLAMQRYVAILQDNPENVDALYYVAVLVLQEGQTADAIRVIERALAVGPPQARLYNLRGQARLRLNQPAEALKDFDRAIECEPTFADAHGNRANVLADIGRKGEAVTGYSKALALRPHNREDLCNRATTLAELGRFDEAISDYDRVIALWPDFADAHFGRGNVLRQIGRLADALSAYDRAIAGNSKHAAAYCNRAVVLKHFGQFEEALASLDRALVLNPRFADAHNNRATVLDALGRSGEAHASFGRAIELNPDHASAWLGRGHQRLEDGDAAGARQDIERAAALDPSSDNIAFSLSQVQLLHGEWLTAWPNYERRSNPERPAYLPLPHPRWNGEPPGSCRLVLLTEQGLGDAIQFCRFAPRLAALGHHVILLTSPQLAGLMSGIAGIAGVATSEAEAISGPDPIRWLPLMSVGSVLHLTPDTIPNDVPYISVDPIRVATWADRLGRGGFRVGIAWQGTPNYRLDRGRSLSLGTLAPLARIPGVRLISLQKAPGSEQIATIEFGDRIETPLDPVNVGSEALLDTAAVIMNLDLVVTSDTMVAHLAGALARPTFVALRRTPDWRWLLDREDTPWYPTMRLFRQSENGVWQDVIARIADECAKLVERGRSAHS
jgi:tetratricopeptide (TPR) repeat protein